MVDLLVKILIYVSIYIGFFTMIFYLLGFLEKSKKKEIKNLEDLPFVSVIIPAWNEEDCLQKTVESVIALNYPKNKIEVLIVDDGSTDNTRKIGERLARKYRGVKVFSKKNGGKGSALNYGIKRSRGEIIVSFDADSIVTENALIKMVPFFDDPKVMAVAPAMKVYKPRGILQRVQAIEYDLGIFLRKAFSKVNAVHVTPGPFSAYRKEFFDKHGGYDEHNITEDMEIAMRIQSLNYKIECSLDSPVYTIVPNKFKPLLFQRRRWYFGMIKNLNKYRGIFGKKYGELGMIILPLAILSTLSVIFITLYYLYRTISSYLNTLNLYSTIGFDFVRNISFQPYLIKLYFYSLFSEKIFLFAVIFMIFSLLMLLIINRRINSYDRPASIFISYVFFLLFYSLLFSFWWIISAIYSIGKKEVTWR